MNNNKLLQKSFVVKAGGRGNSIRRPNYFELTKCVWPRITKTNFEEDLTLFAELALFAPQSLRSSNVR